MMAERITRASCRLCQHEDRDELENELREGIIGPKDLDKRMGWRENTADRHFRNHMGDYHMASNSECTICTHFNRFAIEEDFYNGDTTTEAIAEQCGCSETTVYHHFKHHLKPLVQASAAPAIAIKAGQEMETLRSNVEKLNGELAHLFDNPDSKYNISLNDKDEITLFPELSFCEITSQEEEIILQEEEKPKKEK